METRLSDLSPIASSKKGTIRPLKVFTYVPQLCWRHQEMDVSDHVYRGSCHYRPNMRSPFDLSVKYDVVKIIKDRNPKEEHSRYNSMVVMIDSPD